MKNIFIRKFVICFFVILILITVMTAFVSAADETTTATITAATLGYTLQSDTPETVNTSKINVEWVINPVVVTYHPILTWNADDLVWEEDISQRSYETSGGSASFTVTNYSSASVGVTVDFTADESISDEINSVTTENNSCIVKTPVTTAKTEYEESEFAALAQVITVKTNINAGNFSDLPDTQNGILGNYSVVISDVSEIAAGATQDETETNIETALANAKSGDFLALPTVTDGTQTITVNSALTTESGVTVQGNDSIVLRVTTSGNAPSASADGAIFEDVNFVFDGNTYNAIGNTGSRNTYRSCTFNGLVNTYGEDVFENCTFTNTGDNYCAHVYCGTATFTNCHFFGDVKNVYIYSDSVDANAYFTNCDFNFSTLTPDKSAIMLNASSRTYNVSIKNCTQVGANSSGGTIDGAGTTYYDATGLFGLKHKNGSGVAALVKGVVTLNGTVVYDNK